MYVLKRNVVVLFEGRLAWLRENALSSVRFESGIVEYSSPLASTTSKRKRQKRNREIRIISQASTVNSLYVSVTGAINSALSTKHTKAFSIFFSCKQMEKQRKRRDHHHISLDPTDWTPQIKFENKSRYTRFTSEKLNIGRYKLISASRSKFLR